MSSSNDLAPHFTKKPAMQQEDNGSRVAIVADLEAQPVPEVKWFRDNVQIAENARVFSTVSTNDNRTYHLRLEINKITEKDSGTYKCIIKNRLGEVSASLGLTISPDPNPKINGIASNFVEKPVIKREADGKRIRFECQIKGDPEPTVTWTKNETPVQSQGKFKIHFNKVQEHVYFAALEINDVSNEDGGKYKVEVKNRYGDCSAVMSLNFDIKQQQEEALAGKSKAPTFLEKPTMTNFGDRVLFECKLSADPVPQINWSLGSTKLSNSPKYQQKIVSEGTIHKLTMEIFNITPSDAGEYKVTARNEHGEGFADIKLSVDTQLVNRTPGGKAPNYISEPEIIQENNRLLIKVDLEGKPQPKVVWYQNDREINQESRRYSRFTSNVQSKGEDVYLVTLELTDARSGDAGSYKCVSSNELGECTLHANLQF